MKLANPDPKAKNAEPTESGSTTLGYSEPFIMNTNVLENVSAQTIKLFISLSH